MWCFNITRVAEIKRYLKMLKLLTDLKHTWIAWGTLAQIIIRSCRLKANTMYAFVMLTGRRLRIHQSHLWRNLAKLSGKITGTNTLIIINTVHACSPILTHVILTIIYINCAIIPFESRQAFACVISVMVDASRIIFTGVVLVRAKGNFCFTKLS